MGYHHSMLTPPSGAPGERNGTFGPGREGSGISDVTMPALTPYLVPRWAGASAAVIIIRDGAAGAHGVNVAFVLHYGFLKEILCPLVGRCIILIVIR